jgi:mannose-1-phosphate guanylyltransferase
LVLIEGDFGWDDVGLWSTVYALGQKDESETVVVRDAEDQSPVVSLNAHRNLINTNQRLVVLLGVDDLVVVDSDDVILVLPREQAADVKKIVELLKEKGFGDYL